MARPRMSEAELAGLGSGEVSYIRRLSTTQARAMFPNIEGLPEGILLFSLFAADGTPLAITDSLGAAIGHAYDVQLAIAYIH